VQREWWSRRAADALVEARAEYAWLGTAGTAVVLQPRGELFWWTFAGQAVNASLASAIQEQIAGKISHDNFAVKIESGADAGEAEGHIRALLGADPDTLLPEINAEAIASLKFADCLPRELATRMLQVRAMDVDGVRTVLGEPVRFVAEEP
jgi:ATP-dependent Lhr-like helicase